jgi:hypothetical protein
VADANQLKTLRGGPEAWNEWRARQDRAFRPDLAEADLSGMSIFGANLRRADLRQANLREADLHGADLSGADLGEANLNKAYLHGADLSGANLGLANLVIADLNQADLSGTDLRNAALLVATLRDTLVDGADFSSAHLGYSVFADVDLSKAKGLEVVVHDGPSTIGIDTIYRSGGNIPEVFLRGCGVPEEFIIYAKSLVGSPIEYYSCFISYSTLDQEFAERLHADLQEKKVRCWFAPHNILGGKKIHEQIDEAIRVYDKLLLILSEHSMTSEWVKNEISKARKREAAENRRMLFPIRLVDFKRISEWQSFDWDTGKDSAKEIREYYIPDFSMWKTDHDTYKEEFSKLLIALDKS